MLDRTLSRLVAVGEVSAFALKAAREIFVPPFEIRETLRQIYELGFRSAPLIAVSGLAVGVVLSMHTRASLERFGAESLIPSGLAIALVRETGPLTAALLLSGRIGAGIGAELGAMRVTEQIDALEASAVDSFRYLVVTRVIACIIALPILTTVMNFAGMLGGFIAERAASGMSFRLYFTRSFSLIGLSDYIPATLKTMVFGFIIATVSSYLGIHDRLGDRRGGPRLDAVGRPLVDAHHRVERHPGAADFLRVPTGGRLMATAAEVDRPDLSTSHPTDKAAVRLDRVSKAFGDRRVLQDVTFEVPEGAGFVILGRSGTGKSVTLRHIIGLVRPDAGRVFVEGEEISAQTGPELSRVRRKVGFLFQNAALFDSISVGENVAFPMRRHTGWKESEILARAREKLAAVGSGQGVRQDARGVVRRHAQARRSRPRALARSAHPAGRRAERRARSDHC